MSALRQDLHSPTQSELDVREEMGLIAGSRSTVEDDAWIRFLKEHPKHAKRLGRKVARIRANFNAAYPGETRTRVFSNPEWRKNGFEYVAVMNDLMGRSGS